MQITQKEKINLKKSFDNWEELLDIIIETDKDNLADFIPINCPNTFAWYRACFNEPDIITLKLYILNELTECHGIERLNERFAYVNTGDTYAVTIMYDYHKKLFFVSSCGDIVEKYSI